MRKKGLVPDEVTYNTLLKLCVRGNDMKGANEVSVIISVYFLTFFIPFLIFSQFYVIGFDCMIYIYMFFIFTCNRTFYEKIVSSYKSHLRYLLLSALSHFLFHLITFPFYSFLLSIYLSVDLSVILAFYFSLILSLNFTLRSLPLSLPLFLYRSFKQ